MSASKQSDTCVFCQIVNGNVEDGMVAHQDSLTAVFPSLHQRADNRGHMLVVPVPHVPSIYVLDEEVGAALMVTISRVARAVKRAFSADGVAIKQHNDRPGGQDIFHVHFHVYPCFEGDGFFRGPDRWPAGLVEVPPVERIAQSTLLTDALNSL